MPRYLRSVIAFTTLIVLASISNAQSEDFDTAVGIVEKFDKEWVTITTADKSKKTFEFKITGTSNFSLFAPQIRSGKTVITQRKAEATDLVQGQFIAVIYAEADKEYILLNAVLKPMEKPAEKPAEKK